MTRMNQIEEDIRSQQTAKNLVFPLYNMYQAKVQREAEALVGDGSNEAVSEYVKSINSMSDEELVKMAKALSYLNKK